jgi:FkbM family methyltransferase
MASLDRADLAHRIWRRFYWSWRAWRSYAPTRPSLDGTERHIYEALSTAPVRIIFDVGANVGEMSRRFAASFPAASVYAFEPVAESFAALERVAGPQIKPFHTAIGDREGRASIEYGANSLNHRIGLKGGQETTPITTIDAFAASHGIQHIDILKSDTEGHELHVLRGAAGMLPATRFILVEFGLASGDQQHVHLSELMRVLSPAGFRMVNLFEATHYDTGGFAYGNALFFNPTAPT